MREPGNALWFLRRNVQAVSDEIEDRLNEAGVRTVRREGRAGGRWVLLDFGDLIVHVFHQEERDFYQLERLWKDCPIIDVAPMLTAVSSDPVDLRGEGSTGVQ